MKKNNEISRREALKQMGLGVVGASALSVIGTNALGKAPLNVEEISPLREDFTRLYKKQRKDLTRYTLFKNIGLISMKTEGVTAAQDVLTDGDKIIEIAKTGEVKTQYGKDVTIVDGNGKFLLPGLIDMHSHFFNKDDLLLFAVNGVTTLRCMHGSESILSFRNQVKTNGILGPELYIASPTIADDDLLDNFSKADEIDDSGFDYVFDNEEAELAVLYYKQTGYDFIKVFDPIKANLYKAIAKNCLKANMKLVGHVPANVDPVGFQYTIEHFLNPYLLEKGNYQKIAKEKIWVCPTIYVYEMINDKSKADDPNMKYVSKKLKKEWKKWSPLYTTTDPKLFNELGKFVSDGGRIIAGTDCRVQYVIPGFSIHRELALYVKYGVSTFDALKSATVNAAECLGQLSRLGTVEVGKKADLLLVDANPLENISNTEKIAGVMLAGQWVSKQQIFEILAKIEEARK